MKKMKVTSRIHAGKLLAVAAVCLMMFSGITDTLAINTYVRDLKGMAIPVSTYNVQKPVVALTFDVGQANDQVGDILLQLRKAGVKATFFMTGEWVAKNSRTARTILREGHEVGRSLYTYQPANRLSREQVEIELQKTDTAWQKAGLPEGNLFRAPYGTTDGAVAKIIRSRHENLISWSIDATPETEQQAASVLEGISQALNPGSIVRLGADAVSAQMLPQLIQNVQKHGYSLRTISSLQAEVRQ